MAEEKDLAELEDEVEATRVLERIKIRLLGLPLQLNAYLQMVEALGAGGIRDEDLGLSGAIDWGGQHYTCFQFSYDFRRDNIENARWLHKFILEKRSYIERESEHRFESPSAEVNFDIAAHSMGSLIARCYLRYGGEDLPEDGSLPSVTWAGSCTVDRAMDRFSARAR